MIDTQPSFVRVRSRTEEESVEAAETVERIAWLATVAVLLEIPVLVVEEGAVRNGSTMLDVLERLPADTPVLAKITFGLAEDPERVHVVRATGRSTVVLAGFDTDVCVAQSALGLQAAGFRAIVVDDAVYSARGIHHRRGLERIGQAGIERNHCRGLACEWIRTIALMDEVVEAVRNFGKPPLVPRGYDSSGSHPDAAPVLGEDRR